MKHLLKFTSLEDIDEEKRYIAPGAIYVKEGRKQGWASFPRGTKYNITFNEEEGIVPMKLWNDNTIWIEENKWGK